MSNVSKEQKARIFDQLGIIIKLVRDGKRDPDKVSRALQEIISPIRKNFAYDESSFPSARNIMGKNFLGIPEACEHMKITPMRELLASLEEIPFSEETLREYGDTHILVADLGLSILEIRKRVDHKLFYLHEDDWHIDARFIKETAPPCWRLICKNMVPKSIEKAWHEQCQLLSDDEEAPTARVMVYTIILNYLVTGERMFERINVRTSTVDSDGDHIDVGTFDHTGLGVDSHGGSFPHTTLGFASSRK